MILVCQKYLNFIELYKNENTIETMQVDDKHDCYVSDVFEFYSVLRNCYASGGNNITGMNKAEQ